VEALMSAASVTDTNSAILADLAQTSAVPWKSISAEGVTFTLTSVTNQSDPASVLVATNTGKVARNAAWVRLEKRISPVLNLKERQGLGVEIEGDGSGALVAIRLESPRALAFGAIADRYINVDFTGRRAFSLVETESARWSDYVWNDGTSLYNAYRETIDFGAIESVSVWLQGVPPGRETRCRLGPIHALPLRPGVVKNPKLTVAGATIEFPIELASGSWLECNGPADCTAYGSKGEPLGKVTPRGDWPTLPAGITPLQFTCEPGDAAKPRARVTVFSHGDEL
jgi:hypothetical protein